MLLVTTGSKNSVIFPCRNSAASRMLSVFRMPVSSKTNISSKPMTLAGMVKGSRVEIPWLTQKSRKIRANCFRIFIKHNLPVKADYLFMIKIFPSFVNHIVKESI